MIDTALQRAPAPVLRTEAVRPVMRWLDRGEIDPLAVACWHDLASRSCHHNPFLLPEFLLPAWRYLHPHEPHRLAVVEDPLSGRWLAAGSFLAGKRSVDFRLRHTVATTNLYTFRTGVLLDADSAGPALETLLRGIVQRGSGRHGLEFSGLRLDSILAQELQTAARRLGYIWQTIGTRQVPAVFPQIVTEEYLAAHWSKNRRKALRRSKARLEANGPVRLRLARQPDDVANALETFLRLESETWKGEAGTACQSKPQDAAFIRQMVHGLAQRGHVIISELCVGDDVAASAVNLTAGTALFAYKIGWNTKYAAASPGVLHEAELMLASQGPLSDFTLFDSCATDESYLASLWPERIPVGTALICTSRRAKWMLRLKGAVRRWKKAAAEGWQALTRRFPTRRNGNSVAESRDAVSNLPNAEE